MKPGQGGSGDVTAPPSRKRRVIEILRARYPGAWTYDAKQREWGSATHSARIYSHVEDCDADTHRNYVHVRRGGEIVAWFPHGRRYSV
jgi:hypothetical protein